jgi:hypothetical protein
MEWNDRAIKETHLGHCCRPERAELEKVLEKALQEGIVCAKKPYFSIAFCGVVKAGKSLFLNTFMGRAILDRLLNSLYY